uniref:UDP-N-acetylglucosamine transferase subunit ALG13 n=1 Tax=Panagrolaimus superbus TaxID=310955 RepID=A0A914Z438_9BILA
MLKKVGIENLVIQCGAGKVICSLVPEGLKNEDNGCFVEDDCGLKIEFFRYKKSIQENMQSATLIIGHAGAGTCLESLKLRKPMITVVNDKLMDNHQTELADRLAELGHLICTTPSQLHKAVTNKNLLSPKVFQPAKPNLFANYLYSKLGYVVED